VTRYQRIALALGLVAVDTLVFYLPLTSVLAAYVIIVRPPWFLRLIARLYRIEAGDGKEEAAGKDPAAS